MDPQAWGFAINDDPSREVDRTGAELFLRAVVMPPDIRGRFLARACADLPAVHHVVERLLQSAVPLWDALPPVVELDASSSDDIAEALYRFFLGGAQCDRAALDGFVPSRERTRSPRAIAELIKLDQKWRWASRHPKELEAYLSEWPELRAWPTLVRELLHSECLVRAVHGSPATLHQLQLRFPVLAATVRLDAVQRCASLVERRLEASVDTEVRGLPERFHIVRQVGRGGMGVVYEAIDRQRGARLALKTLPRLEPVPLYRFKREFRSLAGLAHPNLVSLYELISDGSVWFFTMEFVDGVDFTAYCRAPLGAGSGAAPSPPEQTATHGSALGGAGGRVRDALRQLAGGVRALHLAQIVHRDLKPSNVLVGHDGHVVILDFGVVKEIHPADTDSRSVPSPLTSMAALTHASWTKDEDVVGSVPYMAPEQAWRGEVTEASDWYSVGVMLYEALTGVLPFSGNVVDVLFKKRSEEPVPPNRLVGGLPSDLTDLCVRLLKCEPRDRPSGPEVLERLHPGPPLSTVARGTATAAFVGREAQLAILDAAYRALQQNVAVTVHIRGRSGAGKSALAHRYLEALPTEAVLLSGRCYEQESVPYKALDSIVDDLCRRLMQLSSAEAAEFIPADIGALARIFPVLERVDAVRDACRGRSEIRDLRELRRRGFGALGEMFHRIGSRAPLVLFIDDLQWGDVDSAALLISFLESPDPPRLMLIASYRNEYAEGNPCLNALNASRNRLACFDVEVDALPFERCVELATVLLSDASVDAAAIARLARESGGNPYFVYELVRQLKGGRAAASGGLAAAPNLDDALWGRVSAVPSSARHLLEIIAAAGKPVSLRSAYEAAGLGVDAPSALATLRAERLIRATGPTLDHEVETYHDRIRESVTRHVSAAAATELHRQLALAFEASRNPDVEATAAHFRRAGLPERSAHYYVLAGDKAAAALAFGRSAELYGLALALGDGSAGAKSTLHRKRADALANAGRGQEAGLEYQRATDGADVRQVLELEHLAGYQFCVSGHIDEGRKAFANVLAHYGMKLPATRRAALFSLLMRRMQLRLRGLRFRQRTTADVPAVELDKVDTLWSVATGMTIIDPIRGAEFQTLDLILALRAGEPYRIARALAWEAAHVAMGGVRLKPRADDILAAADALARRIDVPHATGMVRMSAGVAAYFHGDFARCRDNCEQAARIFRNHCTGVSWELATCNTFALWPSYFAGEYGELRQRFSMLIAEIRDRGDRLAEADLTTFGGPFVWLAADDPHGARRAMIDVMGKWSHQDFQVQHFMTLTAEAQIDLYCGDMRAAWQRVVDQWSGVADAMLLHVEIVRVYMLHLRARCALAALETGVDRNQLLRSASRDAARLERQRPAYARALAKTIRAALAYEHGDTERAADLLRASSRELDALGWGCFGTAARRRYGQLLGGDAGRTIVDGVDDDLRSQGVKQPDVMARLQLPGFSRL